MAHAAFLSGTAAFTAPSSSQPPQEESRKKMLMMSYPANPGTADSSTFDINRIARLELLVNYYVDRTIPVRDGGSYKDSRAYLKAAVKAASVLKDLEVVRDIRLRREREARPAQVASSSNSSLKDG